LAALPAIPYLGGVRNETIGSWADIKVFVPGTQGDPWLGVPSRQSARRDVGCAANETPMAKTAAAVTITFRRYIHHLVWTRCDAAGWSAGNPLRRRAAGWSAGSPLRRRAAGWSAGNPLRRRAAGWSAGNPLRRHAAGWSAGNPLRRHAAGWSAGNPLRRRAVGWSAGSPSWRKRNWLQRSRRPKRLELPS
jgi:hypothetical protein